MSPRFASVTIPTTTRALARAMALAMGTTPPGVMAQALVALLATLPAPQRAAVEAMLQAQEGGQ